MARNFYLKEILNITYKLKLITKEHIEYLENRLKKDVKNGES